MFEGFDMKKVSERLFKTMFQQVEGVGYDLIRNKVVIKTENGAVSIEFDSQGNGTIVNDIIDFSSLDMPAIAQAIPMEQVVKGDLIVNVAGKVLGFAQTDGVDTKKNVRKQIKVLTPNGKESVYNSTKVEIFGASGTIKVARSLITMFTGGQVAQGSEMNQNPMAAMMPMILMSSMLGGESDSNDKSSMLMMMAMSGALGGNQQSGANPMANIMPFMMMQSMMGNKNPFD